MGAYLGVHKGSGRSGRKKAGEALHPTFDGNHGSSAEREGHTTDGPFTETKEQLGGYYVVDCKNLDEAIQWAAKIPHAQWKALSRFGQLLISVRRQTPRRRKYPMEFHASCCTANESAQDDSGAGRASARSRTWAIIDESTRKGVLRGCSPLQPSTATVSMRAQGGSVVAIDGPFVETKEALGGYYIIDCRRCGRGELLGRSRLARRHVREHGRDSARCEPSPPGWSAEQTSAAAVNA